MEAGLCRNVLTDRRGVHGTRHTQRPGEGPPPLSEFDATGVVMQPGTTAGGAMTRVGDDGQGSGPAGGCASVLRHEPWVCHAVRTRRHDDAEQLGSRSSLATPDTGSDGTLRLHSLTVTHSVPALT